MSLPEILKTALDQMQYIAKTETVFGDPIEVGEITLIPISKVSIGFAAGGANSEKRSGAGSGTGGGVQVTPVAFISISGEKVQIHSLDKSDQSLKKILAMAPDVIKKVSQFMDKKSKKGKESEKNKKKSDKED
ncbi:GerW family sporulation protein [Fibrobacterota bacterium]